MNKGRTVFKLPIDPNRITKNSAISKKQVKTDTSCSTTWKDTPITYMLSLSKQKGSQAKSRKAVHISTYYSTTCEAIKS